MTLLEEIVSPLTAIYIKEVWLKKNPSQTEILAAYNRLALLVATRPVNSTRLLCDVVKVLCVLEQMCTHGSKSEIPLPSTDNFLPTIIDTADLCVTVLNPLATNDTVSFYVYSVALKLYNKKIKLCLYPAGGGDFVRLKQLMTKFANECKFKKTSDLFIWTTLFLKVPPWLVCATAQNERPYAFVSRCYAAATNTLVHPLIRDPVVDQLSKSTGVQQFCLLASLALELTNHNSTIVFNHKLLHADKDIPTFAVARAPFTLNEKYTFGVIHKSIFTIFDDAYEAIYFWSILTNCSSSFVEMCCDDKLVSCDNEFAKFL